MTNSILRGVMMQIHILQICCQEVKGNKFKTSEKSDRGCQFDHQLSTYTSRLMSVWLFGTENLLVHVNKMPVFMPETGVFKDNIKADSEVPIRAKKACKSRLFKDSIKQR